MSGMTARAGLLVFVLLSTTAPAAKAQGGATDTAAANLPTVTISRPVTANGQPLAPGTYGVRITMERPRLPSGAPSETQRWVEFVADGKVVAREIAEILTVDEVVPVGTSTASSPRPPAVQLLKEGNFVRVSIWEAGERYLIYLPAVAGSGSPVPDAASPSPDPGSRP